MHGHIDHVGEEGLFKLLREESLAADFGQGAVEDAVGDRVHHHQLRFQPRICGHDLVADHSRLRESHGAAAGADAERALNHGRWTPVQGRFGQDRLCRGRYPSVSSRRSAVTVAEALREPRARE